MPVDETLQLKNAMEDLRTQIAELTLFYQEHARAGTTQSRPEQVGGRDLGIPGSPLRTALPAGATNMENFNLRDQNTLNTLAQLRTMNQAYQNPEDASTPTIANPIRRYQQILGQFAPPPKQPAGGVSNSASMPQEAQRGLSTSDALTLSMLGEHGGPAALRNMALESYGLQRSIGWAQNITQSQGVQQWAAGNSSIPTIPGVNPDSLDAISGILNLAQNNPGATYVGYKGVQATGNAIGAINTHLQNAQAIGQQFGYGAPPGGQNIFGFHNPLGDVGTAAQVGMSFDLEKQALQGRVPGPGQGFGNGLSGQQATDVLDVLGNQGFSMQPGSTRGDAATIGQGFMRPLMQQYPGLSAEDLGQFTPSLRNAGTSVQQLTTTLSNLGQEAKATKETVSDFSQSVAQTGSAFESMGSTPQGGYGAATGFANAFGMDPGVLAQAAQSPMFQGLAMSRMGVLPSGLGDTNAGALGGNMNAEVKMLQEATAGLNRNKYETVNGQQVLVQSGQTAQLDQMSSMSGIPSNILKRMIGDMPGNIARSNLETYLGQSSTNTGLYADLNQKGGGNKQTEENYWNKVIAPNYKGTGVSQQEMQRLGKVSNMSTRATDLQNAIGKASGSDAWNQIQNNPNQQTVQITLSKQAQKMFGISGPSGNKQSSNAGGTAINVPVNSTTGDISSSGMFDPTISNNISGVANTYP